MLIRSHRSTTTVVRLCLGSATLFTMLTRAMFLPVPPQALPQTQRLPARKRLHLPQDPPPLFIRPQRRHGPRAHRVLVVLAAAGSLARMRVVRKDLPQRAADRDGHDRGVPGRIGLVYMCEGFVSGVDHCCAGVGGLEFGGRPGVVAGEGYG